VLDTVHDLPELRAGNVSIDTALHNTTILAREPSISTQSGSPSSPAQVPSCYGREDNVA
jgi:hypothetical protein